MKKYLLIILLLAMATGLVYYLFPEKQLPPGARIDKLVVYKSDNVMEAYENGQLAKTYKIALGRNPVGDKISEGDKRTPEGAYVINDRNPNSGYYKNLGVSYPNTEDIRDAKQTGVSPGGQIKIHGLRNGLGFIGKFHRIINWTAGCIAVTNKEMDELFASVQPEASIVIKP
jgi:murein L,D-transpeptidase YafK